MPTPTVSIPRRSRRSKRTTFGKACHITLKDYLRNELEADTDDKAAGNSRTHIAFRKVWKTVAVAAITLTLLFSTCMVANAQFRERVISWVIETFEKYSIFELHGDELDELQDLTEYQAGYLPDGAILQDTTKQPNTEPGIVLYEYAINEAESFEIMIIDIVCLFIGNRRNRDVI